MLVDDRIHEPTDGMSDGRRAVAHPDHLDEPRRLEPRWDEQGIGAGVDPAGHLAIEPVDEGHPTRMGRLEGPDRGGDQRIAVGLDDESGATSQDARRRIDDEVEPLLRIEPSDRAEDRVVVAGIHPESGQQVAPTSGLAGRICGSVRRGQRRVGHRVPDVRGRGH